MSAKKLILWFLPAQVRRNKAHPEFYEMYAVATANIVGSVAMSLIPLLLLFFNVGSQFWTYYLGLGTYLLTLFSLRTFGCWRLPTYFCALVAYYIVYTWLRHSGLIYSTNVALLHLYLIAVLLVNRRWGLVCIINNILFFVILYYLTITGPIERHLSAILGSPLYALLIHSITTAFIGGLMGYVMRNQETNRREIRTLQDHKIGLLNTAVRKRTEQLNAMRQTLATDFHDQTGNMLAAINRQAAMLELKLQDQASLLPLVHSIITNSDELYASSKDFLWNLNHDSDDPLILFQYLSGYGQRFYNQFDISFATTVHGTPQPQMQLHPLAGLSLIYIFKEAMSNVVKHSGADEVSLELQWEPEQVVYTLHDTGVWKEADPAVDHYGLRNMERRCRQSGFSYALSHDPSGTRIRIGLALNAYHTQPLAS